MGAVIDASAIVEAIDAVHESRPDVPRGHLGGSLLGHHCERCLWLSFRWAVRENFEGRMLRLFRRGHKEEDVIISDLRSIGIHVADTQRRVILGCHVSGSLDGVARRGVPGDEKSEYLLEFKTHGLKSFDYLEKHGVEKAKPMHYVQMQAYMHGTNIHKALYVAVCKNDDRLHMEVVYYDKEVAEKYIARGHKIALAERLPPPISTDPSWFQCKFCAAHSFCHKAEPVQHASCRTCAHVTPTQEGRFHCGVYDDHIPEEYQLKGCDSNIIHPDLVPWEMRPKDDRHVEWLIEGKWITNGPEGYKSSEILAQPQACGSEIVEQVKSIFEGAEIIG